MAGRQDRANCIEVCAHTCIRAGIRWGDPFGVCVGVCWKYVTWSRYSVGLGIAGSAGMVVEASDANGVLIRRAQWLTLHR